MSTDAAQQQTAPGLSQRQKVVFIGILLTAGALWFAALTSPIPYGGENIKTARPFLKEQFPDRKVESESDRYGPVAVIYEVIRSGEPKVARRAIDFAAEQRFGYAAPYVIERLGSGDAELERAAQNFLQTISGRDYGPDAESWRAWWRDPPWPSLGLKSFGQTTMSIAIPALMAFAGIWLIAIGRLGCQWAAVDLGPALVGFAWMWGCFLVLMRLGLDLRTCTFGPSEVEYYYGSGTAVGLEDAKIRFGTGLWILWVAVLAVGTVVLLFGRALVGRRPTNAANDPANKATT
jgi:hypothetical protein